MDKMTIIASEVVDARAVLRDVATRDYIDQKITELRIEMKTEIGQLRSEIGRYLRWTVGLIIVMWTSTLIPLLLRMLGVL